MAVIGGLRDTNGSKSAQSISENNQKPIERLNNLLKAHKSKIKP